MRWLMILTLTLLSACTTTKYVPVESVRTEYVHGDNSELLNIIQSLTERLHQKERQVDSLMQSYRELLVLSENGDTLRHDREKIVYRASHRESELEKLVESKSDSIRELLRQLESVKSDSIPVPYPVERSLSRWEKAKMDFGGFAIGATVLLVVFVIAWLIKRYARHA